MKCIVSGGRDFTNKGIFLREMDFLNEEYGFTLIIHGGAKGVDQMADEWARQNRIPVVSEPALWNDIDVEGAIVRKGPGGKLYNAAAGPIRNQRMLDEYEPDMLVAFPTENSIGTMDMIDRAYKADIIVIEKRIRKRRK